MSEYASTMMIWIESAKSCSQLATAAMFLPVFYLREIVAIGKDRPLVIAIDGAFIYCWIAFISAIALSHTYQITATKLIAVDGNLSIPLFPRAQYWLMVASLIAGLSFFIQGASDSVTGSESPPTAAPLEQKSCPTDASNDACFKRSS